MSQPALINLGCGHRYHAAWTNVDLHPAGPGVIRMDIGQPLPFADGAFDAVYHSNVLEHIRRSQVGAFMAECARICRRGGILRIAVPDLEVICRLYLEKLAGCLRGDAQAKAEYDWLLLELLDQMVREVSGGEMGAYLKREPLPAESFVFTRIGNEGREFVAHQRRLKAAAAAKKPRMVKAVLRSIAAVFRRKPSPAERVGAFRLAGEVHQWMYDRYSLGRLLEENGFLNARVVTPWESDISSWQDYHLEVAVDGSVNKPDSLVMEATKA